MFQELGVNAVRIYAVNPSLNHDAFMCALKSAGIYLIVGLAADCENCAVQWSDPPACYPVELRERGEFIINQFARYENVLGFSAGNEVALSADTRNGNLPCQKKFLKDMRKYVNSCAASGNMRTIPVGIIYADNDRDIKQKYYSCITDPDDEDAEFEVPDFLGINAYLHCDGTATDIDDLEGYKALLSDMLEWKPTMPIMLTEFGCLNPSFPTVENIQAQRNFLQVDAIFSPEYQEIFNGGFVFEYSTEAVYADVPYPFDAYNPGNYGIGYFTPEDCNHQDVPCDYVPFPQFQKLADRYKAVTVPTAPTLDSYQPKNTVPLACPAGIPPLSAFDWPADSVTAVSRTMTQCPAFVPTYCTTAPYDIPPACTTLSLPGSEGTFSGAVEVPATPEETIDSNPVTDPVTSESISTPAPQAPGDEPDDVVTGIDTGSTPISSAQEPDISSVSEQEDGSAPFESPSTRNPVGESTEVFESSTSSSSSHWNGTVVTATITILAAVLL